VTGTIEETVSSLNAAFLGTLSQSVRRSSTGTTAIMGEFIARFFWDRRPRLQSVETIGFYLQEDSPR
jgi:hypothetical protein